MAAAYLTQLSGGQAEVRSARSEPGTAINPAAVAVMAEVGIDISAELPKILTVETVETSDVVITMAAAIPAPTSPASGTKTGSSPTPPARTSRRSARSVRTSGVASFPC
jgi:protein-tyrosine-phosphatase